MRRFIFVLLCLLMLCLPALGEWFPSYQPQLEDQEMLAALEGTPYAHCTLYLPLDSERPVELFQTPAFTHPDFIPLIAERNGKPVFLLLERKNEQWTLAAANEKALCRENMELFSFSVQTSISPEKGMYIDFGFRHTAAPEGDYFLYLHANKKYGSYFSHLSGNYASPGMRQLYAYSCDIHLTAAYAYEYNYNAPHQRFYYDIHANASMEDSEVSAFDLSSVPLNMLDTFVPGRVAESKESAQLMQLPHEQSALLAVLSPDTPLLCEPNIFPSRKWLLVFYGNRLGYMRADEIEKN